MAGGKWRAASNLAIPCVARRPLSRQPLFRTDALSGPEPSGACGDRRRGQERARHVFVAGPFLSKQTQTPRNRPKLFISGSWRLA